MISPSEAIRRAHKRVAIVRQGDGYVLHTFTPRVGTRISHPLRDIREARQYAAQSKIEIALALLGYEDKAGRALAGYMESVQEGYTPDWREVVRITERWS